MRVHFCMRRMTLKQADLAEYYLKRLDGVPDVKVYDRTCDLIILYHTAKREEILSALSAFSFEQAEALGLVPEHTGRALNREFEDKLVFSVLQRMAVKLFLPFPVRSILAIIRSIKYLKAGLSALIHGKLSVSVLDATSSWRVDHPRRFRYRRIDYVYAWAR